MDKLRKALSGDDDDEEKGIVTQIADASTLSWSTRIKGFAICFVIGVTLSIISTIFVFFSNWTMFALLYTFGNITALVSTCFLMGPINQIKRMFEPTRLIATLVMICMLVLTLLSALLWHNGVLALLFCVLQFFAMAWYCISYIPFARDAIKKCFTNCVG